MMGRLVLAGVLLTVLCFETGCRSKRDPVVRSSEVQIQWLGHASFRIVAPSGIVLITDPFDSKMLTYPVPERLKGDVISVSHEGWGANHLDLVDGMPQTIRSSVGLGANRAGGMLITGYPMGLARSHTGRTPNAAFVWEMGGMRFCHLGSLVERPSDAEVKAVGKVDVLFLPIGNLEDIPASFLNQLVQQLGPRIIIPMSYRTQYSSRLVLSSVGAWSQAYPEVIQWGSRSFILKKEQLPGRQTVVQLPLP